MVTAIVGANWGDEGKGKLTDMLGEESDIIVRFQGGSNAGHTIVNNYGKFALHILPSGVFYDHTTNVIGNGVALNIPDITEELRGLVERGVPMRKSGWQESPLAQQNPVLRHSFPTNLQKLEYRYQSFLMKRHCVKR